MVYRTKSVFNAVVTNVAKGAAGWVVAPSFSFFKQQTYFSSPSLSASLASQPLCSPPLPLPHLRRARRQPGTAPPQLAGRTASNGAGPPPRPRPRGARVGFAAPPCSSGPPLQEVS
ncbi:hypothetical protein VPH35_071084 [Triticum aestivum]